MVEENKELIYVHKNTRAECCSLLILMIMSKKTRKMVEMVLRSSNRSIGSHSSYIRLKLRSGNVFSVAVSKDTLARVKEKRRVSFDASWYNKQDEKVGLARGTVDSIHVSGTR